MSESTPRLAETFQPSGGGRGVVWTNVLKTSELADLALFVKLLLPGEKFAGVAITEAARHVKRTFKLTANEETISRWIREKLLELRHAQEQEQSAKLVRSKSSNRDKTRSGKKTR